MLHSLPVSNCMHFLMPTKLDDWSGHDVPGIIGVLGQGTDGKYRVLDAFDANTVPDARQLALDERFGAWVHAAGGIEMLRFDVFLMPKTDMVGRNAVLTLLERSCGYRPVASQAYAYAV